MIVFVNIIGIEISCMYLTDPCVTNFDQVQFIPANLHISDYLNMKDELYFHFHWEMMWSRRCLLLTSSKVLLPQIKVSPQSFVQEIHYHENGLNDRLTKLFERKWESYIQYARKRADWITKDNISIHLVNSFAGSNFLGRCANGLNCEWIELGFF